MILNLFFLLGMFFSLQGTADDTTLEFGKITSGAAGLSLTSISSKNTDDGEGRFHGFALVNKSGAMSLDLLKVAALKRPEGGTQMETTQAISGGIASANVVSGSWTRPNVIPTVGTSDTIECAVSWADAIGSLPQPDGVYSFFDGYYCMTSGASCTPTSQFSRYFGSGGPESVPDGERICYNAGLYGYNNSGVEYSLDGESSITCTNICS